MRLGYHVDYYPIANLVALLNGVTDMQRLRNRLQLYRKEYVIADEQKENEHFNHQVKEAAKAEIAFVVFL